MLVQRIMQKCCSEKGDGILDIERMELACFWMSTLIGFGLQSVEKFVEACGGLAYVFSADTQMIRRLDGLSEKLKEKIIQTKDLKKLEQEYNKLAAREIHFVGRQSPRFPQKLKHISSCPFGLFYMGQLPDDSRPSLAVVGARNATAFGQETARYFARVLSQSGIQIISGLAMGIDGWAHRGALEGSGQTWGVLGCGVNICYPKENIQIFERMKHCGGILSEFYPGEKPLAWHFPYRNRIISGLCDRILVVEARQKSGSLITAAFGLEQGKDIFAIPGRPVDAVSAGCNSLIADGAKLVCTPEDILEEYKISVKLPAKNKIVLDNLEKLVYSSLCLDAKSVEQIAAQTQLDYTQTVKTLISLTSKGYARQVGKNYYISRL